MRRIINASTFIGISLVFLGLSSLVYLLAIKAPTNDISQKPILISQLFIAFGGLLSLTFGYAGRVIDRHNKVKIAKISLIGLIIGTIIGILILALVVSNRISIA